MRPLISWDPDIAVRHFRTSNLKHSSHYGSPSLGIVGPASMPIINCPSEIERRFDSIESPSALAKTKKQTNTTKTIALMSALCQE